MRPEEGDGSTLLVDGFLRHDVSATTIYSQAHAVGVVAGDVEDFNADLTKKHQTAREGVAGVISTAMEGADTATKNQARALIQGITAGAGAIRVFGAAVETFDATIDELNTRIRAEDTRESQVRKKVELSGRHAGAVGLLQSSARTARSQLTDPLDPQHIRALFSAGALPSCASAMFSNIIDLTKVELNALPYDLGGLSPEDQKAFLAAHKASLSKPDRDLLDWMIKSGTDKVNAPFDDPVGLAAWQLDHLMTTSGTTASWFAMSRYGRLAPRVNGRFVEISPTVLGRTRQALSSSNWRATPYGAGTRAAWSSLGTKLAVGGGVVSVGTAGWDQWKLDERAGHETDERVGRAATRAVVAGGAGWAGAWAGAQLGGAIGTAVGGPVGTVVGGFVGGVIGGVVASGVGHEVADHLVDWGGDVGDKAGDAISDVGDALSFWD